MDYTEPIANINRARAAYAAADLVLRTMIEADGTITAWDDFVRGALADVGLDESNHFGYNEHGLKYTYEITPDGLLFIETPDELARTTGDYYAIPMWFVDLATRAEYQSLVLHTLRAEASAR